jgi:hypothetical protein
MATTVRELIKQLKTLDPNETIIWQYFIDEDFLNDELEPVLNKELFAEFAQQYRQDYINSSFYEDVQEDLMDFVEDKL